MFWRTLGVRGIAGVVLLAGCALSGCSSAAWQKYESSVDSRSVRVYGKDSGDSQQVGVGYTVHYK